MQQTYRPSTFLGAAVVLALIASCTVESSGNHSNTVQRSHARRLQRLARVPATGAQEDANEQTVPESVNRSRSRPSAHVKRSKTFQSVNSEELETLKSSSTPYTDVRDSNDSKNQSKTYQLKKNKSDIYMKSTLLPTTETQTYIQDITTELPTIVTENVKDYITSGGENFGFSAKITQDVTYSTQSSVSKNNSRRKTKHEFHPDENDDVYGYFNSESVSRNSFNSGKAAQNRGRDRHKAKVSDRNANLSEKTLEETEQIPLKVSREKNVYEAPELSNFGTTSIHYTATDSPITEYDRDREDEMLIKATTYSPTTTTLRADLDVSEKPSDSKTTHRRGRYVKIVKHIPAHTLTTDPQYGVEDYTTDSFVTEKFTLEATNSRNGRRRAQRVVKMIRRIPSDKAVHHQDNATETHEVTARQTPNFNKPHRIKKLVKIIRKNITNHETTTLTPSTKIDFLKDSTVSNTETGDASEGESTVEGYFGQNFNKNEISTTLSTFETVTDSDSVSTTSFPYVYEGRTRGSRRNNEAHQRRSPKETSDEQTQRSRSKGKRVLNVIDDENPGTTTTSSVQRKITNNKISNTAEEDFYLGSYSTNTETIEVSTVLDESVHSNIRKREAIESSPTANRRSKPTNSRVGPTGNYRSVAGSISSETSRKMYNPIYQRRQIVEYRNSGSKYKINSERKMTGKVKDVLGNNTENNSKSETTTESQVSDRKHHRNYLKSSVPYSAEPTTVTYTTNSTERLNLTEPSDGSVYFMTTQKPINELQTNSVKINSGGKSREYVLIKRSTTLSDNSEEKVTSKTANYINPSTQKAKVQTQLPVSNTVPAVSKNILTVTEPPKETIGSAFRKRLVRLTKLPTINPIFPYKNPTHSSMEITTENTIVSNVKHTANPLTASSTLRHISVLDNSTSTTEMSKNKRSDIGNTLIPTGTTERTIVITQKRFIPSTEPYREKLPSTFGNSITLLTVFSKNNTVFSSKTFPTPSTNSVEQTNSSTTQKPVTFTRELPIYNSNFDTKNSPKNSSLVLTSEHVKLGDLSLSKQNITEINKQKYSKETLKRQEIRKPFNDAGIPREDGSDSTSLTEALTSRAYKVLGALQQVAGAVMEIPKQLWLLPVRFGIYPGIQRTQDEIPQKTKFPCQRGQDTGDGVPTSVHKLRPQDIKVVAALGDSITSANGALANNEEEMRYNYRGVSAMGGGQGTWRRYLTLPNIIKEFNPKLLGYSLGTVETNNPISGLNVAENGAIDDQLLQQAFSLIKKMREDHFIDFHNDWKLVNIMIGGNDICNEYCYQKNDKDSPSGHARQLEDTLTYLKNNLPRTFVNLIHIPNVLTLQNMKNMPIVCHMKHLVLCSCLFGGTERVKGQSVSQMLHGYWEAERRVAEDEKFDTDNFTVVLQPFFLGVGTPDTVSTVFGEVPDLSYFAPDCFHFSQKGNAQVANALWNNMLEPVGNKTEGWEPIMARFNCPSKNAPYIFTRRNSKAYTESGHQ